MADKNLQSITFPGIANKYKIPQVAPAYSASSTYAVGDYVNYAGTIYRCTTAITTAEAWTAGHWTAAMVSRDFTDLKSAYEANIVLNAYNLLYDVTGDSRTYKGVKFTYNENAGYVEIVGKATSSSFANLYSNVNQLPKGVVAGNQYHLIVRNATNAGLRVGYYNSSGSAISAETYTEDTILAIPSNAVGMYVRAQVDSGVTVNETIYYSLVNTETNAELSKRITDFMGERFFVSDSEMLSDHTNINTVTTTGCYALNSGYDYGDDCPIPSGFLLVFNPYRMFLQVAIAYTNYSDIYIRRKLLSSASWSEWIKIPYTNTYNVNNTFNSYSSEYTLTASPEITTDTNNYLAASGTSADRTADIAAMLAATKVCHLGPGVFYVKNLVMPSGSRLYGCGKATQVTLMTDEDAVFAVKMGNHSSVSDLWLYGQNSAPTSESNVGSRCGLVWQGTYTADQNAPQKGLVSNIWISSFDGSGVKCEDTGTPTYTNIEMVNSNIWNCGIGINISLKSEFNKFVSVNAGNNKIGCVNNGGNNVFIGCDFSGSKSIGFLMDNTSGLHTNNSHGSAVGCIFNHIASNTGIGIKVINCAHGFIFDGCQLFFSQIYLEDAEGIVISNSNFGNSNDDITIKGGGAILFTGNMHGDSPEITITNNANVHFVNCFVRSTGASVVPN